MIILGKNRFPEDLAKELNAEFVKIDHKIFPDGESYLRITEPEKVKGEKAVIVLRGQSSTHDHNMLMAESLLLLDKVKELGAKKICLVLPFMPYSKQDKEFLKGEPVSVKIFRDLLKDRCDLLINISSHDFREEGWISKGIYNIDGTDSVADFLKTLKFNDPIVIAPDMTADKTNTKIAKSIKGNILALKKERDKKTGEVKTYGKVPNLHGQELIIHDDIVETGGTILNAIDMGKKAGARKIIVTTIHPILSYNRKYGKNCLDLIRETEVEFYATDTIESPVSRISVIPQLARKIKELF